MESGAEALQGLQALPGLSGFGGGVHERHDAASRIADLNTAFWSPDSAGHCCMDGVTPLGAPNPKAGPAAHTGQQLARSAWRNP